MSSSSSTFSVVAAKVDKAEALERVNAYAKAFGVTIDSIQEIPKHLEVELAVTVTGDPESIDGMHKELTSASSASDSSFFFGPASIVLDPINDLVGGAVADRFKRWRQERADRHHDSA